MVCISYACVLRDADETLFAEALREGDRLVQTRPLHGVEAGTVHNLSRLGGNE